MGAGREVTKPELRVLYRRKYTVEGIGFTVHGFEFRVCMRYMKPVHGNK